MNVYKLDSDDSRYQHLTFFNMKDVVRLRAAGYDAFLVGELLMRAERPGEALRALLVPSAQYPVPSGR